MASRYLFYTHALAQIAHWMRDLYIGIGVCTPTGQRNHVVKVPTLRVCRKVADSADAAVALEHYASVYTLHRDPACLGSPDGIPIQPDIWLGSIQCIVS